MPEPFLPEFVAAGPPPSAADMRRIVEALRRVANLDVIPPLRRTGNVLSLDAPDAIWAKALGSISPYDLVEMQDDGTGASWVVKDGGVSCSDCYYEANGVSGLGGKVFRARKGKRTGEWRFGDDRFAPPCLASFEPGIFGCVLGISITQIPGCTLTLRDSLGDVVLDRAGDPSCLTDSTGSGCIWDLTPGASYTLSVDPPAGVLYYLSTSFAFVARCNLYRPLIGLPIADGFVCCPPCEGQAAGIPIPSVLTLDYGSGSTTLTYTTSVVIDGVTWHNVWYGQITIVTTCHDNVIGTDGYGNTVCVDNGPQTVVIDVVFQCGIPRLTYWIPGYCTYYQAADGFHFCPINTFSVVGPRTRYTGTPSSSPTCDPPDFVFTFEDGTGGHTICEYPVMGGIVTVITDPISLLFCNFGFNPQIFTVHD